MKKKDVDEVVVVGGSSRILKIKRMVEEFFDGKTLCRSLNGCGASRILKIKRMVEEFFDRKTLCRSLNGNEVVASGAAILAVRLSGNDDDHDMKQDVVKNTCIPTSMKTIVHSIANKTSVCIRVFQGEGVKVKDNLLLGSFILNGLTLGINGMSRIEVCFNLNVDGILLVSAEEISTG
nr:hypothetical protein [Tanacetum cinerariifolium]